MGEETHGCRCVGLGNEVEVDLQRGGAEITDLRSVTNAVLTPNIEDARSLESQLARIHDVIWV